MKKRLCLCFFLIALSLDSFAQQDKEDIARSLLEQAFAKSNVFQSSEVQDFKITIELKETLQDKEVEHHRLKLKSLKSGSVSQTLVRYLFPPALEGTTYLVHMNVSNRKPEAIWVYLPAFEKTKSITPFKARKSLPKSFTQFVMLNDEEFELDNYTLSLQELLGDDQKQRLLIEMVPKTRQIKQIKKLWLDQDTKLISKVVSLDSMGKQVETLEFSSYTAYAQFSVPEFVTHIDHVTGRITQINIEQFEFNLGLKVNEFLVTEIQSEF